MVCISVSQVRKESLAQSTLVVWLEKNPVLLHAQYGVQERKDKTKSFNEKLNPIVSPVGHTRLAPPLGSKN
jgi:hypothetical protein